MTIRVESLCSSQQAAEQAENCGSQNDPECRFLSKDQKCECSGGNKNKHRRRQGIGGERCSRADQQSGGRQSETLDGAVDSRRVNSMSQVSNHRNDEKCRRDQSKQSDQRAGNTGNKVADADQIKSERSRCGAAGGDGCLELLIGDDVIMRDKVLLDDRQRCRTTERGQHGLAEYEIQDKQIHSRTFQTSPTSTARPRTVTGDKPIQRCSSIALPAITTAYMRRDAFI